MLSKTEKAILKKMDPLFIKLLNEECLPFMFSWIENTVKTMASCLSGATRTVSWSSPVLSKQVKSTTIYSLKTLLIKPFGFKMLKKYF